MYNMREEREREVITCLLDLSLASALAIGPDQSFLRSTFLPTTIPRWVPDSARGRSGQGQTRRAKRIKGHLVGPAVGIATDLSLLIPRPETSEKRGDGRNRVRKEGEIVSKSERTNTGGPGDVVEEWVVGDNKKEGGEGATLFDPSFYVNPVSKGTPKKGGDLNGGKGTLDKVTKPEREPSFD